MADEREMAKNEGGGGGFASTAAPVLLIVVAAFLVYSNTLAGPFLFDDEGYIVSNGPLRDLGGFLDLSGTRYLAYLSFALNYAVGGLDPFGYHLVNTSIHAVNGATLFFLTRLLFKTPRALSAASAASHRPLLVALVAALIFVCHPVQTQAVSYITQRMASLATMFYLLSVFCYLKSRVGGGGGRVSVSLLLSFIFALAAMKTKEIGFTLPFALLLMEVVFFSPGRSLPLRSTVLRLAPFFVALLIIPLALFTPGGGFAEVTRSAQVEELAALSSYHYLMTQFTVVVKYVSLVFLPVGQNLYYDYPLYTSFLQAPVFASFLFIAAVLAPALYFAVRGGGFYIPLLCFGVVWFFLALSVESTVVPIKHLIFEHRMYLPMAGAAVAFSSGVFSFFHRFRVVPVAAGTLAVLALTALPLGVAAHKRNVVWTDALILWTDTVEKSPGSADANYNLAVEYGRRGRPEEAIAHYEAAIGIKPDYVEAMNNMGNIYIGLGRYGDASRILSRALDVLPDYGEARYNLGTSYLKLGDFDGAIAEYAEALRLDGTLVGAHFFMARAYEGKGDYAAAAAEYERALVYWPKSEKVRAAFDRTLAASRERAPGG